ncbi:MAG: HXXEE domain-containing protein [Desulfatitalea sp.]|nr:HXXEE domain-containing protein [Desulfatitalea sp.]NNJ99132.1 HXXEE domain-containing protein [Desulfatitalea sp.]
MQTNPNPAQPAGTISFLHSKPFDLLDATDCDLKNGVVMKNFIFKYNLYFLAATGVTAAIYTAVNWSTMPVLQRMVGLIFPLYVLHELEEFKFPGGFAEMAMSSLDFSLPKPEASKLVVTLGIFTVAFVPFFFHQVAWLAIAPMLLGIGELFAHFGMVRLFKLERFYSPGMVTSVLMAPVSIYCIIYVIQNNLMQPVAWLFSILYIVTVFLIGQVTVVRINGMSYFEFIKNGRASVLAKLNQK